MWWLILFCIQPNMNNIILYLGTFCQFLCGLLNDTDIDIINIAISYLSLYKAFSQNHPEDQHNLMILTPGTSLNTSQSMVWQEHSGNLQLRALHGFSDSQMEDREVPEAYTRVLLRHSSSQIVWGLRASRLTKDKHSISL